jgi:hypothetical protein
MICALFQNNAFGASSVLCSGVTLSSLLRNFENVQRDYQGAPNLPANAKFANFRVEDETRRRRRRRRRMVVTRLGANQGVALS